MHYSGRFASTLEALEDSEALAVWLDSMCLGDRDLHKQVYFIAIQAIICKKITAKDLVDVYATNSCNARKTKKMIKSMFGFSEINGRYTMGLMNRVFHSLSNFQERLEQQKFKLICCIFYRANFSSTSDGFKELPVLLLHEILSYYSPKKNCHKQVEFFFCTTRNIQSIVAMTDVTPLSEKQRNLVASYLPS